MDPRAHLLPSAERRGAFLVAALVLSALAGGGCGDGAADASETAGADGSKSGAGPSGARAARSLDPELVELRARLDFGELTEARALLKKLSPREAEFGVELPLLRARAAFLAGDAIAASRHVEAAREASPTDPRVYATAAELHAAGDRLETAGDEIARGLEVAGTTPELLRAQGVLYLCRSGGAGRGLELLEQAVELDAGLPFVDRALAQAHLLMAKDALRLGRGDRALAEVELSLKHDPRDLDARRLFADVLAGLARVEDAAEVLAELVSEGQPLVAELALMEKRSGVSALLRSERDRALEYFASARAHGLALDELGTGGRLLAEAAVERYEAATAIKDRALARAELEQALRYQPDYLAARNHLAVLLYQDGMYEEAAEHWRVVLDTSRAESIELPDPVSLHLARALVQMDRRDEAIGVLRDALERAPESRYVPTIEKMLGTLGG